MRNHWNNPLMEIIQGIMWILQWKQLSIVKMAFGHWIFSQNGAVNLSSLCLLWYIIGTSLCYACISFMLWNVRLELRTWINEDLQIEPWAWKETYLEYRKIKISLTNQYGNLNWPRPTFGLAKKIDLACLPWLSFLTLSALWKQH